MPVPNLFGWGATRYPGCLKINYINIAVDDSFDFGPTSRTNLWTGMPNLGATWFIVQVFSGQSPNYVCCDPVTVESEIYWFKYYTGFDNLTTAANYMLSAMTATTAIYPSLSIYDTVTSGITLFFDTRINFCVPQTSAFRTGYDLSGNGFKIEWSAGVQINRAVQLMLLLDGVDDYLSMSGSSTIYSSDFTWQFTTRYITGTVALYPLMWSGSGGTTNFGISYTDLNTSGTSMVIQTSTASYSSTTVGTNYNGFSGQNGVQSSIRASSYTLTTITKQGNNFTVYWDNAVLKWTVTIPTWSINNSFPIYFGTNSSLNTFSNIGFGDLRFYNRVLSTAEISRNFSGITQNGFPL